MHERCTRLEPNGDYVKFLIAFAIACLPNKTMKQSKNIGGD